MAAKHKGLGRGLSSLISDGAEVAPAPPVPAAPPAGQPPAAGPGVVRIPVEKIHKSPWQPRHEFAADAIEELTHSVREHGVLQPLLLRRAGDHFELIAGERRLRAARNAELADVPAIVMDVGDREALELALIENLQREDLNLIEEAEGYRALLEKFEMTQEQVAQRLGRGRATIANALRLLNLPDPVKSLVAEGRLSPGHAKVLLGLEIPREIELLAARCVAEQMSVRTLERVVQRLTRPARKPRAERDDIPEAHLRDLSDKLHQHFGTGVRITPSRTLANGKKVKGCITIDFYNNDDLDRVLVILGVAGSL